MQDDESIREYYSILNGEIPYSQYENRKVMELSRRISADSGSGRSGNVHIISGTKLEQVRRIAFLTCRKLLASGSEIITVGKDDPESVFSIGNADHPVFAIDEAHVRDSCGEEDPFKPELIREMVERVRSGFRSAHAVFLSISQDTYDSEFRKEIEEQQSQLGGSKMRPGDRIKRKDIRNEWENTPWYAMLLPGLSFLLSPIAILWGSFNVFTIALTIAALVILFRTYVRSRSRSVTLLAGSIMLTLEICVPLFLSSAGMIPNNEVYYFSSTFHAYYTEPMLLFLLFQSIAAVSFFLIPLSFSNWKITAAAASAFIMMELAVILITLSVGSHIPHLVSNPGGPALLISPYPFIPPYNALSFGLLFMRAPDIGNYVVALAMASEIAFGITYIAIAAGQKIRGDLAKAGLSSRSPNTA